MYKSFWSSSPGCTSFFGAFISSSAATENGRILGVAPRKSDRFDCWAPPKFCITCLSLFEAAIEIMVIGIIFQLCQNLLHWYPFN
mmetsp:Transcript_27156/g.31052  ORF Transcript_27156/g.31052 Transcript_27156/m.31052 type:complete len:85 (-) Transcript_27156:29-283(-)